MKYQNKRFSVAMPGGAEWPFDNDQSPTIASAVCGECGADAVPGSPHMDKRDDGRPKRRVCFGKVIAR